MKQFYTFSLLCLLILACTNQLASSSDKKRDLTLHLLSNASSSKPRYHTRLVTKRRAQEAEKLADQLERYKKLEKKRDASTPLTRFNYLDLPIELQREVSAFYGVNQLQKATYYYFLNSENPFALRPPLQFAIRNHDSDQVQILLALHAHINGTHADSFYTPLYLAIDEYYYSLDECYRTIDGGYSPIIAPYAIFKHLLKKGVDCNKPNLGNQKYALISTAKRIETIPLFLDLIDIKDINLHVTNKNGETVLDLMKKHAMRPYYTVNERKGCYRICTWLESQGVASSVILEPIPTDEVMQRGCCNGECNQFV